MTHHCQGMKCNVISAFLNSCLCFFTLHFMFLDNGRKYLRALNMASVLSNAAKYSISNLWNWSTKCVPDGIWYTRWFHEHCFCKKRSSHLLATMTSIYIDSNSLKKSGVKRASWWRFFYHSKKSAQSFRKPAVLPSTLYSGHTNLCSIASTLLKQLSFFLSIKIKIGSRKFMKQSIDLPVNFANITSKQNTVSYIQMQSFWSRGVSWLC